MFTTIDFIVAGFALAAGAGALLRHGWHTDLGQFLLAFSSATSAAYLIQIAYAFAADEAMLRGLMRTNPVVMVGAMAFAAVVNLRALIGVLFPRKPTNG